MPAVIAAHPTRDSVIEHHLPLVRSVARRYAGGGEPLEDLVQVGAIGLIKAVDRYDPTRGVPLEAYAATAIAGEIRHHLRDRCTPVRLPRRLGQHGVHVRFDPLDDGGREEPAGDPAEAATDRLALTRALRRLHPRTRRLVTLCFFGDLSQARAAAALGISPVHASRLLHEALGLLRQELSEPTPRESLTGAVAVAADRV